MVRSERDSELTVLTFWVKGKAVPMYYPDFVRPI